MRIIISETPILWFRNLHALSAIVFKDKTLFTSSESPVRSIEVMSTILLSYTYTSLLKLCICKLDARHVSHVEEF